MNLRAFFLFGALLASPGWAQEPATKAPALTPASFDLSSDYIRKIVRDTAATQYGTVQVSAEKPAGSEPATVRYVPPDKPLPPAKIAAPRPVAAPQSNSLLSGFLDAVVDTVIDEALGIDDDIESQLPSDRRLRCPTGEPPKATETDYRACPGVP